MTTFVDEYDRYIQPMENRIIRCIWRIVRNEHDAQDALQDTLALVWKRRERVFTHPNPPTLILRMCIHSAHDVLRRRLPTNRISPEQAYQQVYEQIVGLQKISCRPGDAFLIGKNRPLTEKEKQMHIEHGAKPEDIESLSVTPYHCPSEITREQFIQNVQHNAAKCMKVK